MPQEDENPNGHFCQHLKNNTTNLFGSKLGESTENNKALVFFSGKETFQTFHGSV